MTQSYPNAGQAGTHLSRAWWLASGCHQQIKGAACPGVISAIVVRFLDSRSQSFSNFNSSCRVEQVDSQILSAASETTRDSHALFKIMSFHWKPMEAERRFAQFSALMANTTQTSTSVQRLLPQQPSFSLVPQIALKVSTRFGTPTMIWLELHIFRSSNQQFEQ